MRQEFSYIGRGERNQVENGRSGAKLASIKADVQVAYKLYHPYRSLLNLSTYAIRNERSIPASHVQLQTHDTRRRIPFVDMVNASLQQHPNIQYRKPTTLKGHLEFISHNDSVLVVLEATPDRDDRSVCFDCSI
ncbi:MAG: hypothetical protein WA906_01040, partial [Pacificimonas sp.]